MQWDPYRGQQKHIIKLSKCSDVHSLQIGLQHGRAAKIEIERGLRFYEAFFQKTSNLSWSQACDTAAKFEPLLSKDWPDYCAEMKGMADCHRLLCIIHEFTVTVVIGGCKTSTVHCSRGSAYHSAFLHRIIPQTGWEPICSQRLQKLIYDMHCSFF